MINCTGNAESAAPLDADERLFSVFHIAANQGEPTLMCTYRNEASGTWITQPLITGVESLQLLFGTHQVTAGRAPTSFAPTTTPAFVEQYLRPDQLLVTNNANASNANWARVRSVRVGMVLRGPVGSLGAGESAPQYAFGTPWLCQAADTGCLMDSTADGRLRHSVSFTVHLRNPQYIP
jgi:type IV pilus assembly protein PilW